MISITEVMEAIQRRHACKVFDPDKKIEQKTFETILETGRLSPSSFGIEPWKFLVVQDPKLRSTLAQEAWGGQNQIPSCSHLVVILCRGAYFMRYDSRFVEHFMREVQKSPEDVVVPRLEKLRRFQIEDFDMEGDRALFDWSLRQTYIPLANMMTIAAFLGVDSCPIEGFNMAAMNRCLTTHFGMDQTKWGVSCLVAFGYRLNEPKKRTRQELSKVVEWF